MKQIKRKILLSYLALVILLVVISVTGLISSSSSSDQYNKIINNTEFANSLNNKLKYDIPTEIWNIVSGKISFTESNKYLLVTEIYDGIDILIDNSISDDAINQLRIARRANDTLKDYIDLLGAQISAHASVSENEAVLEEIRGIVNVEYDILQQFVNYEIEAGAELNNSIRVFNTFFIVFQLILISGAVLISVISLLSLTGNINKQIELNVLEQKELRKSEMKTMQAQITPHFLYNTFDTIIWLIEKRKNSEAVATVEALSNFFRVSLSGGNDWITVNKEIEHIKSYLSIQQMRYSDILEYKIEVDKAILENKILKLMLQPLVENAIYHGIKYLRKKGTVTIKGWSTDGFTFFSVADTGVGMDEEATQALKQRIKTSESGSFGLYNINKRIELYYNSSDGIEIESTPGVGTVVTLKLPENKRENDV